MCLVTKQKHPIILKKDKKVFKILKKFDSRLLSQFQNFKYKLDQLYSTEVKKSNDCTNFDNNDQTWYRNLPSSVKSNLTWIGSGFHAATTQKRLKNHIGNSLIDVSQILVECTIPAGSIYYANKETQLCVSNQIIINKIL